MNNLEEISRKANHIKKIAQYLCFSDKSCDECPCGCEIVDGAEDIISMVYQIQLEQNKHHTGVE